MEFPSSPAHAPPRNTVYARYPGLTRARCIRFLLFKFNHMLVYKFITTELSFHKTQKKRQMKRKGENIMLWSNFDQKSRFSGLMTEPLNQLGIANTPCQSIFNLVQLFHRNCREYYIILYI